MSTLYQEPIRGHYVDEGDQKVPCLIAGLTSDDRIIVIQQDGSFERVGLDSVSIDFRYDDAKDRWGFLEDMIEPQGDPDDS